MSRVMWMRMRAYFFVGMALWPFCAANAQVSPLLNFELSRNPGSSQKALFELTMKPAGTGTATSPEGTLFSGGTPMKYSSLELLEDDIVGTWTLTQPGAFGMPASIYHFDVISLEEGGAFLIPPTIAAPPSGKFSGKSAHIVVSWPPSTSPPGGRATEIRRFVGGVQRSLSAFGLGGATWLETDLTLYSGSIPPDYIDLRVGGFQILENLATSFNPPPQLPDDGPVFVFYNYSTPTRLDYSAVPEPASLVLTMVAISFGFRAKAVTTRRRLPPSPVSSVTWTKTPRSSG